MKTKSKKSIIAKSIGTIALAATIIIMMPLTASAHCDTMDGPVIKDAKMALEENNIKYISKWVFAEDEAELTDIFNETMKVRNVSPEAKELADKYLFENLVRIHRAGEGAPYTGIKPEGTPAEKAVAAADKSIEVGSLEPFHGVVDEEKIAELEESFKKVMALKDFDTNDVEAGREFVEAYVTFTHLAEGESGHTAEHEETHVNEIEHSESQETEKTSAKTSNNWLPWALAGIFLITNIIAHVKLFHLKKHSDGHCNH